MALRSDRKAMAAKTTGLQRPGVPGETGSRSIPVSAGGGEDPAAFHMSLPFSSSTVHVRPGRQTDRQTNTQTHKQTYWRKGWLRIPRLALAVKQIDAFKALEQQQLLF